MKRIITSRRGFVSTMAVSGLALAGGGLWGAAQRPDFDLLLRGGHVIDPRNKVNGQRDVAIRNGTIAAVAAKIDPARAATTVAVSRLDVTPGPVHPHVHVSARTRAQT